MSLVPARIAGLGRQGDERCAICHVPQISNCEAASPPWPIRRAHTGWLVDPAARDGLLAKFAPRYARVVAHHVTLKFGDRQALAPQDTEGEIVGEADDGRGVQALVVRIDGATERPDGATFHITWSLAGGRQAQESNAVIAESGWRPLRRPVPVRLIAKPPD